MIPSGYHRNLVPIRVFSSFSGRPIPLRRARMIDDFLGDPRGPGLEVRATAEGAANVLGIVAGEAVLVGKSIAGIAIRKAMQLGAEEELDLAVAKDCAADPLAREDGET